MSGQWCGWWGSRLAARSKGEVPVGLGAQGPPVSVSRRNHILGSIVGQPWKILVADRNRHVRDLLRRELAAEGYLIQEARDGHEVWLQLSGPEPPDILILDLDIPYADELVEMAHFREGVPLVPMILFTYLGDYTEDGLPRAAALLEKREDINRLKQTVAEVLHRLGPRPPDPG